MWPLDTVWTFRRDDERLQLRIAKLEDGISLVEHHEGLPDRSYFFPEFQPLIQFEKELIAQLKATGWAVVDFSPERRSGRERRLRHERSGPGRRGSFHPGPS
jgi:hypothetical protein